MPITVRFTPTAQLYYHAQRAISRNIKWMRWGGVFVVVLFPLYMIAIHLPGDRSLWSAIRSNLGSIVGFPLVWLIGIPLAQWWAAGRTLRSTPAARGERSYVFDDQHIEFTGGLSNAVLSWPAIVRVVETRDLFLLFLNAQLAHFIPKSAFASSEDISAFRAVVARQVPSAELAR